MLLDPGQARLLLGLELEPADMLVCLPHALAGSREGAVGITLGRLGAADALASLQDAGVYLGIVSVAKGPMQQAAMSVAGLGGAAEDTAAPVVIACR